MAADVDEVTDSPTDSPRRLARRSGLWFLAIAVAQGAWLAVLMSRGWFYQDDITFLAQASGRSLGLTYLTDPVNDHLTPGLRLAFWVLRPLGLDHHWVTIVLRVVLQAAATLLLARLLVQLVGDRVLVRWVVAAYAFSPLLLGPLWLSCAMNVLPAQLFVLLGFAAHVRYTRSGRLRSAAWAGVAFVLAAMFWELSAVDLLLLPLLSIGFLHAGSSRERLRAMLSCWPGWLLTLGPTAAFAIAYAIGGYGNSARSIGVGAVLSAWWREWAQTVAPLSLGGPWRWAHFHDVFFSPTATPIAAMWIVQAVFVIAFVLSVRRTGWTALLAWALPAVNVVVTATVVAIGRYHEFGFLSFRQISYAFDAAVPLAIAACIAFCGVQGPGSVSAPSSSPARARRSTPIGALAALLAVVLLGGAALSAFRFSQRWRENPTRPFVAELRSGLAAQPGVHLFDTPLPTSVLPYFQPDRYLSDLLPLIDVPAATADNSSDSSIIDNSGRIVDAAFVPAASVRMPTGVFCGDLYHGVVNRSHRLSTRPGSNEWFIKLDYFQQHPTVVYVTMIDDRGREWNPVSGSRVVLEGTLASQYLRFPYASPAGVRIRTTANDTNLCVAAVTVGSPLPKATK